MFVIGNLKDVFLYLGVAERVPMFLSAHFTSGPTASFLLLSNCKKIIDLSEGTFLLCL